MTAQTIITVTKILREAHPQVVPIFTQGGCYEMFRALHAIDPRLEPYHDGCGTHVYGRLGNTFFDINGPHDFGAIGSMLRPMHDEPRILKNAERWKAENWK